MHSEKSVWNVHEQSTNNYNRIKKNNQHKKNNIISQSNRPRTVLISSRRFRRKRRRTMCFFTKTNLLSYVKFDVLTWLIYWISYSMLTKWAQFIIFCGLVYNSNSLCVPNVKKFEFKVNSKCLYTWAFVYVSFQRKKKL